MNSYDRQLLDMLQNQVTARGINDARILEAMQRAPRHLFVPEASLDKAYDDHPLALPAERATISQPYMVAYMTDALRCPPQCRVLEIGTGSGYQAAILSFLCREVFTIERYGNLRNQAETTVHELGRMNVHFKTGDGLEGWPDKAPFDRIIITAAARKPPKALAEQLAEGGSMLIPLGDSQIQTLTRVTRTESGFEAEKLIPCVFVPIISNRRSLTEDEDACDWIEPIEI